MRNDIKNTLNQKFGFKNFRSGQKEVIERLLSGNSAIAVFPTGAGKSLCYQLPALYFSGLTLVISPLLSLMKDQIDSLLQRGIKAARLDSTLSVEEYRETIQSLKSGRLHILYVAPERFNNERFREIIKKINISLFAVDEAHCISEWGHNFRPDYLKLPEYGRQCGAKLFLALTATATTSVLKDICLAFNIKSNDAIRTGFYRPNLKIEMTYIAITKRDKFLINQLRQRKVNAKISPS